MKTLIWRATWQLLPDSTEPNTPMFIPHYSALVIKFQHNGGIAIGKLFTSEQELRHSFVVCTSSIFNDYPGSQDNISWK